ncbi:MAG: hypothetical protein ACOCZQ_00655 [Nanoarchaeota archaeon]
MTEYLKYVCKKCNYKFKYKPNPAKALKCPYCADENVIRDNLDLNKLINSL